MPCRVRELALGLASMKIIERKTSDPANYAKLGVEAPDTPTATSTLVEVVAGNSSWSLIVGKNAEGRAIYVRKPKEAASALVEPAITVEPDPKRWIDRELVDIPGASVHDISVKPAGGPAYLLSRAKRGDIDLTLSPIPKGPQPREQHVDQWPGRYPDGLQLRRHATGAGHAARGHRSRHLPHLRRAGIRSSRDARRPTRPG